MKSVRKIFLILTACAFISLFAACGGTLAAPEDVDVNLDNELTWSPVQNASVYTVEIRTADGSDLIELTKEQKLVNTYTFDWRRTLVELSNSSRFALSEGDYIIRIKALGKTKGSGDSDWSDDYAFHKDYETGCKYTLINGGTEYEVNRAGRAQGSIVIEDYYRGRPVTRIADQAFKGNSKITEITLGNNVTYVGKSAFSACPRLEKVVLPESLTEIGDNAFQSCAALKEITIPASVKHLPYSVFAYCSSLSKVNLSEGLESIGNDAFSDSGALTEITIPDSVTTIGSNAFASAKALKKVKFGSGLKTVGAYAFSRDAVLEKIEFAENSSLEKLSDNAFSYCNLLTGVVLPEGLQDIGEACFYETTELKNIVIPRSVTHIGVGAFNNGGIYLESGEYVYADNWLVAYKSNLRDVTSLGKNQIKNGTYAIADSVFTLCPRLNDVTLPSSLEILGTNAFAACTQLYKVVMPKVRIIGQAAFASCAILSSVDFGDNLQTIEKYAFFGCTTFDNNKYSPEDTLPSSVRKIGALAFYNTKLWNEATNGVIFCGKWAVGTTTFGKINGTYWDSLTSADLHIPIEGGGRADCVGIGDYAFIVQWNIPKISGLENIRYIGEGAFYGCQNLGSVTFSDDLREIPDYAFAHCLSLAAVTLPDRLRSIGRSAFFDCQRLRSVTVPETVESVGEHAFNSCINLTEVVLPESLEEIASYTFYASAIKNITVGANVKKIGTKAFGNSQLAGITFTGNVEEIGYAAFYKTQLTEITLPDSLTKIEKSTFYGANKLKSINFGSGVKEIGDYAFYGADSLENIVIPENVQSIGSYAFAKSVNIRSVVLGNTVKEIGDYAFYGDENLTLYFKDARVDEGKAERWNSSFRPEIYGCTFENGRLKSFTVSAATVHNSQIVVKIVEDDSERFEYTVISLNMAVIDGYECVGFTTVEGSDEVQYTLANALTAPEGTVLYAIWKEYVAPSEPEQPSENPGEDKPGENPDQTAPTALDSPESASAAKLLEGAYSALLIK
ncbi:MAG: leucine-rich repeat domain-containing protein [Firmicutes bacterium]|nr:leucine-rich repeat domain-containing protein [Bacillota bacterium]MDY5530677.1 leucine-rich repeat domain-containing protein [Pumilibacteraceae bacterium]